MKTDAELTSDVVAEFDWDPAVGSTGIRVSVHDGVVTLAGQVPTYAEKHAVRRAVRRVAGVKAIECELDVALSREDARPDSEIAAHAEQALCWNAVVPPHCVRVAVDHGWVTLQGDVDWDHQRRAAEEAIRPLVGVVDIENLITLRAKPHAPELSCRIEETLVRQALREAKKIHVNVEGGIVTLSGTVRSPQDSDAAQGVVWASPGVQAVINELRVN